VGPGQCFGELALMSGELRAANVMALDNSVVRAQSTFGQPTDLLLHMHIRT
jgi:CRP-like cAMP-binding protein